ncbi:hypothetical protein ACS0TY_029016 [Phlomoides rotata]
MEFTFDIFEIYRQYCEITSRAIDCPDEAQKVRMPKEQLWKMVESRISRSVSILDELQKLMSRLHLMAGFSEFSRFYGFVFFICRENGQKNLTVGRAVMAWRLVLSGRFRLLNQWCNFVEKNQRYNISEDTWRQVLAFSRCVHENLEGYDPEAGAWPILIDEFVEYMYRVRGPDPNCFCNCGDSDSEHQQGDTTSSGLTNIPGSKRKLAGHLQMDTFASSSSYANSKKRINLFGNSGNWGQDQVNSGEDDFVGIAKQSSPLDCAKSPCSVEGSLSKGFAGLLSGQSCSKFDQDRRVSYT